MLLALMNLLGMIVVLIELVPWLWENWAAVAIAFTLCSLALFVILLTVKYVRICLNIFVDTPPPLSMGPMDFEPLHGEVVRFRSFDGTSLRGMFLSGGPGHPYRGMIVFCHEYGSDMYSCARYTRPLVEAGFDVFTFDFRGHGESSVGRKYRPIQWPSDKELEDALGAFAYVESVLAAEGTASSIGVFGISRGAGAAILAASSDPNVKAMICDGAFSTETTLVALMKRWAHIFARVKLVYEHHSEAFWKGLLWLIMVFAQPKLGCKFPSVVRALRNMQARPMFFIHGQKDSYIREDQTRLLYDAAPDPKYIWIVEGAKHNQSVVVARRQYASRTTAFFRKYLAEEAVPESAITFADQPATTSEPTQNKSN
jgi:pimeloyl-ACP methyl ester carboxylesterase